MNIGDSYETNMGKRFTLLKIHDSTVEFKNSVGIRFVYVKDTLSRFLTPRSKS